MMYLSDLRPSITQFHLTFKAAFHPTGKPAKKQQNHLKFKKSPKEQGIQQKSPQTQD